MKTVNKSVLIWHSAQEMFALVADIGAYPKFLPWCEHASVLARDDSGMTAELGIAVAGVHHSFTTRNDHLPGPRIVMKMLQGPFSRLEGEWTFSEIEQKHSAQPGALAHAGACRVGLHLRYGFNNAALAKIVGPVFDRISNNLVDAFVKRAGQVYG